MPYKPDPANDPYAVIPMPAKRQCPPTGWWTVTITAFRAQSCCRFNPLIDAAAHIIQPKAAAEVATTESAGVMVRMLKYRLSPISTKITISDGRVSGVALDIAAADDRELPTYSRSVWPGIHRMAVLRMLGEPAEDRFRESLGMKLEHMIFARAGQADLTVVLIDDGVVTRKAGRALPPDIFALSLPLATGGPDQGIERPRSTRMHLGMSMRDAQALFGAPKHSVPYTFKGQPAEYRIYEQDGTDHSVALTSSTTC